jgi:hypothetical protein
MAGRWAVGDEKKGQKADEKRLGCFIVEAWLSSDGLSPEANSEQAATTEIHLGG